MKKTFALLLAAALMLSLAACGPEKTPSGSESDPQESVSTPAEGETQPDEQTVPAELLDTVLTVEVGTAGSSLKAAAAAAALLDWREDTALTDADFTAALTERLDAMDEETRAAASESLLAAVSAAETIVSGEGAALLEDAGNPQTHEQYTAEKQTAFLTAVREAAGLVEG